MTQSAFLEKIRIPSLGRRVVRIAAVALGAVSLSACAYGVGDYGGYGGVSVGVGSGGYAGGYDPYCDAYSAWDGFYGCDSGLGFGQIGFGGGYWDNFYYPGYGTWIYDRPGGRRFAMQNRHRQYWGQQRWQYQQQRRGGRQEFRQDRRDDRRDYRRENRRETLDDRRDWRQERRNNAGEVPRTRQGERERMGGLTPEDRQRRMERWEQRQQDAIGQPRQGREGRRNWQGNGGAGNVQGIEGRQGMEGRQGRGGEGRQRPAMRQPSPQVQPGGAPPRAERPQRQQRIHRSPGSAPRTVPDMSGLRPQDTQEN